MAIITVHSNTDSTLASDGRISLRKAITIANNTTTNPSLDTIVLDPNDTLIRGAGSDRILIGQGRGSDFLLDFEDGIDGFLLESTLTFEQLTFAGLGNSTQIKFDDEVLVTVIGVGRSLLDASDFAPFTA